MSKRPPTCAARALVESAHDGRLDRRDLAALERHLASCRACATWAAELARIRVEVRRDPSPSPPPLELARIRLALLRRAATDERREDRARPAAAAAVALVLLVAVAVLAWPQRTRPNLDIVRFGAAIPLAAKVTFTASAASDFKVARERRSFELALVDGTTAFWVRKLGADQRVLVTTRDAVVEVRGTVFQVTADHGRLVGVHVDGGVVEVRRGDERRLLHAGEGLDLREARADDDDDDDRGDHGGLRGAPPIDPRAAAERADPPLRPVTGAPTRVAATAPRIAVAENASKKAPTPEAPGAPTATPVAKPSANGQGDGAAGDFARAVKNLDYADYPRAAEALTTFVEKHPDDARAEDAAFLAVVALQKTGRRADVLAAARAYLRRFPNGARRAEVRRWAAEPGAPRAGASPTRLGPDPTSEDANK